VNVDHVGECGIECHDGAAVDELRITDVFQFRLRRMFAV
jgi:hypothetical protein